MGLVRAAREPSGPTPAKSPQRRFSLNERLLRASASGRSQKSFVANPLVNACGKEPRFGLDDEWSLYQRERAAASRKRGAARRFLRMLFLLFLAGLASEGGWRHGSQESRQRKIARRKRLAGALAEGGADRNAQITFKFPVTKVSANQADS